MIFNEQLGAIRSFLSTALLWRFTLYRKGTVSERIAACLEVICLVGIWAGILTQSV